MALLAESLVEEWLNRLGFFTIRGIKHGVHELDLLGIRKELNGSITGWHVEVQASFRPVGYIAKLTDELIAAGTPRRSRTSAVARMHTEVEACARAWVRAKFRTDAKKHVRDRLWPGVDWSYHLVHAVVREPQELRVFQDEGVTCHAFRAVIFELLQRRKEGLSGSAGGDLAEIIGYYETAAQTANTNAL
jgi:hypothetical protein